MKLNLKKSSAFTLVELLLVVGIIALGSVVAYITLPKVQSTARANAEATSLNTLSAGIKNVYAGSNNFTKLENDVLIKSKAAPDKMTTAGATTLTNSFGGDVVVTPATLNASAGSATAEAAAAVGNFNGYAISVADIPSAECNKLATGVGNNFVHVTINGTPVKTYPQTTGVDAAAVSTECAADSNVIVFFGN